MSDTAARIVVPGLPLSVAPGRIWSPQPLPREVAEIHDGLGSFLLHVPSGIQLNVRVLPAWDILTPVDLEDEFQSYADVSWPGARRTSNFFWTDGGLHGVAGVFDGAMPGSVVREWLLTDGKGLANAATFATQRQWDDVVEDFEALVRSIRFE